MTHKQTHLSSPWSQCNKNGKCTYGFPQPLQPVTTVNEDGRVELQRDTEENRWISPHVPFLINELECHIHVDLIASVWSYMYLYKYLHKGPDNTNYSIGTGEEEGGEERVNETADFQNAQYLSAGEAAWRILGYHVSQKQPGVGCLTIHLPGRNYHQFPRQDGSSTSSQLLRYLHRPLEPEFDNLTIEQYFSCYKFEPFSQRQEGAFLEVPHSGIQYKVVPRPRGDKIVHIMSVSPVSGELFYLQSVLQHHPGRSFNELRTVCSTTYETWHKTALALGLFESESEGHYAMQEAIEALRTPAQLRFLFARVLLEGYPAMPIWDNFREYLIRDHVARLHSESQGCDQALRDVASLLSEGRKRL
jgi:hypothetical protein